MNPTVKLLLGILAVALTSFGMTYQANSHAEALAYAASIATSLGAYLAGLFQEKPAAK